MSRQGCSTEYPSFLLAGRWWSWKEILKVFCPSQAWHLFPVASVTFSASDSFSGTTSAMSVMTLCDQGAFLALPLAEPWGKGYFLHRKQKAIGL